VPLVAGSLLELPVGIIAGDGRKRRPTILGGGLLFIATLLAIAAARSFIGLLIALVLFFPASGAFVSLTQSALMDADPPRQAQHMARWNLAGSVGAVAGPLLLAAVLAVGAGWRVGYLVLAGCAAAAWLATARAGGQTAAHEAGQPEKHRPLVTARTALHSLRRPEIVRWVVLLQVADLLLDVLTGFLALYLVDVVHATPAEAALGLAVRLGAGLAGDTALVGVLERVQGPRVLRASAAAATLLYPTFLLVPGLGLKLVVLAALSAATAPWYPLLQAGLYGSLPGRSPVAVTLGSAAGLVGSLGPLAVGFAAQRLGLAWALAGLAVVPAAVLAARWPPGGPQRGPR
jgi:MFS transporter, FSR family, fosmidomycin resistance protein